jgi:hypothetical protein
VIPRGARPLEGLLGRLEGMSSRRRQRGELGASGSGGTRQGLVGLHEGVGRLALGKGLGAGGAS